MLFHLILNIKMIYFPLHRLHHHHLSNVTYTQKSWRNLTSRQLHHRHQRRTSTPLKWKNSDNRNVTTPSVALALTNRTKPITIVRHFLPKMYECTEISLIMCSTTIADWKYINSRVKRKICVSFSSVPTQIPPKNQKHYTFENRNKFIGNNFK